MAIKYDLLIILGSDSVQNTSKASNLFISEHISGPRRMFSNDHQNSTYIIYEREYQNGVEKVILWLCNMYEKFSP